MIFVLFRIDTKALSNEVNLDSVDVLDQTRDRRHQLLHDVPVYIGLEAILTSHYLIETEGSFLEGESCSRFSYSAILLLLLTFF